MSQENVEIVKAAYEADYRGDEQAMLELLAEDVIVKNPCGLLDVPAFRHGRQGWRDLVAEFREVFDDFVPDVKEWVDAGDWGTLRHALDWKSERERRRGRGESSRCRSRARRKDR